MTDSKKTDLQGAAGSQYWQKALAAFNNFAPVETTRIKQEGQCKWISSRTRNMIMDRDFNYQRWRTTKAKYHLCEAKLLNKHIKRSVKHDMFQNTQYRIGKFGVWKALRSFGVDFGKTRREINRTVSLNEINMYYCNMGFPAGQSPYDTLGSDGVIDIDKQCKFVVTNCSTHEMVKAWKALKHKNSKIPDTTGLSKFMLQLVLPIPAVRDSVLKICNDSFSSGVIPNMLKLSRVALIEKVKGATSPEEFRPVVLSPNLLLLMEMIYSIRLEKYLYDENVLSVSQFGYRKLHNTEHLMLAMTDLIRMNVDKGLVCALVTIDYQKAFDSCPRGPLLEKLCKTYNILLAKRFFE
ncbi:uncharacterized protein LOC110842246 isoform X4 [Folsomia candida]|uniref:uncharacterized protein LOC110842246 isoform X4 n=1 Tax=Folsomia candida TaxID=158441 RepID=UPI0016054568|nr:uncharacterized protein LOC110842246 isoform X4 [Folsomia candida]